jgi:hypothetical protein
MDSSGVTRATRIIAVSNNTKRPHLTIWIIAKRYVVHNGFTLNNHGMNQRQLPVLRRNIYYMLGSQKMLLGLLAHFQLS